MGLALRNLSSRTITLKRGTVVAHISAAKEVPHKLAPKVVTKAFPVNTHSSALPGMEAEIERKPTNPDVAMSAHSSYSREIGQALWKTRFIRIMRMDRSRKTRDQISSDRIPQSFCLG